MPWSLELDKEEGFVELTYDGVVDAAGLMASCVATINLARENNVRLFFADLTRLVGGHSIADLFELVEQLTKLGFPRGGREALLYPVNEERVRDVQFWETVCLNRGFQVRGFDDRAAALAWLKGKNTGMRSA